MRLKPTNFKIERIKANYTIQELSEHLNITYRRVQNMEHSKDVLSYITYKELKNLANLYQKDINELATLLDN